MDTALAVLALTTGLIAGGIFRFLHVPIPAPPTLPGLLGIVGLFLGYQLVEYLGVGVDVLALLGLS
jgi:XapX domain-containing protein